MNSGQMPWVLPAAAALLLRVGLGTSLLLLGCYLGCRFWTATRWKKRMLQGAGTLLCLLVLVEWLGVIEAVQQSEWWSPPSRPARQTAERTSSHENALRARKTAAISTVEHKAAPVAARPGKALRPEQRRFDSSARPQTVPGLQEGTSPAKAGAPNPAPLATGSLTQRENHNHVPPFGQTFWPLEQLSFALLALWLLGTVLLVFWWLAASAYWYRRGRRWPPVPQEDPLWGLLEEVARQLGLQHLPSVVVFSGTKSPLLGGLWRPRLILPAGFSRIWSPQQQRAVLAHELAHLVHRDPLWQALLRLATVLLWWHPGVWLLARRWRWWAELAADNAVARFPQANVHLAEALLTAARQIAPSASWPRYHGAVAFQSPLGNRIQRLLGGHPPAETASKQPSWWSVCVCVVLGLAVTLAPATVISASDPSWTGEPAMRTASWWRRSALTLVLLSLTGTTAPAQEEPRRNPPPEPPHRPEAPHERAGRPPHRGPFQPHRVRHHGPSPEERLERLVRIAEELERLGLREEAQHMRRRAEEFKEELERRRGEHRERFRGPEHAGPGRPFRPRVIHRPEFPPGPPPHPPAEAVEELRRVVRELHEVLRQTQRELEESRHHFQRELEATRRHLERVTERLERLERLREEEESEGEEEQQ